MNRLDAFTENDLAIKGQVNILNVDELYWGRLKLNVKEHSLYFDQSYIRITKTEFKLLCLLMMHPRQVFSRNQILVAIDVLPGIGSNHLIDTHASRIRRKILEAGGPLVIDVIRGVGFRLADPARYPADAEESVVI